MYNGYTPTPTEISERQLRTQIASITGERWYGRTIDEMLNALDCTCSPDTVTACVKCRIQAQARYGDEIPFDGK